MPPRLRAVLLDLQATRAATRAHGLLGAQHDGHDHPLAAELHIPDPCTRKPEHPVECGRDPHAVLLVVADRRTASTLPQKRRRRVAQHVRNLRDLPTGAPTHQVAEPFAARQAAAEIRRAFRANPRACRRFGHLTQASSPLYRGDHRPGAGHPSDQRPDDSPAPIHPQTTRSPAFSAPSSHHHWSSDFLGALRDSLNLAVCGLGLVATMGVLLVELGVQSAAGTRSTHPVQATFLYDLAQLSKQEHRVLIPKEIDPGQSLAAIEHGITVYDPNGLLFGKGAPVHFPVPASAYSSLRSAWLSAIVHDPGGWLDERLRLGVWMLSIGHPSFWLYNPPLPQYPPPLFPSLNQLEQLGLSPREVALDGGFNVGPTRQALERLGPERTFIAGRQQPGSRRTQHRLARYRTGSEGRISHMKRGYGLRRTRLKDHHGMQAWTGWSILTYNLDTLAIRAN